MRGRLSAYLEQGPCEQVGLGLVRADVLSDDLVHGLTGWEQV